MTYQDLIEIRLKGCCFFHTNIWDLGCQACSLDNIFRISWDDDFVAIYTQIMTSTYIQRLFQHTFGTHPEQPVPKRFSRGISFIIGESRGIAERVCNLSGCVETTSDIYTKCTPREVRRTSGKRKMFKATARVWHPPGLQRQRFLFCSLEVVWWLQPRKLTWNPKMEVWKMFLLFQGGIFRFHISFRGCIWLGTAFFYF